MIRGRLPAPGIDLMNNKHDLQDRLLVEQCLNGSKNAWDEFYDRFLLLVRKVIHTHMRCGESDMQDMVQNVFVALFGALKSYDPHYPLSRFIWTIGERVCIDEFRKSTASKRDGETVHVNHDGHQDGTAPVLVSNFCSQEEQVSECERCQLLKRAFQRLGDLCRELLRLRFLEELSFKEIVALLGGKEKTLAVQAGRCLDELKMHYVRVERERSRS
jgi:RNA polymerase sigma factor (sigma-70 family)